MTRAPVIARRELSSYFYSPIAYVALTLFLMAAGYLFWRDFQPGQPAGMRTIFDWMVWLLVFIGLFCSSLTRSQVVAAVSSVAILFLITIAPWWALREGASTLPALWRRVVDQGVYNRYVDFSKGVVDSGHVVFFVAVTAVFLFLTTTVLESRRC